jgi:hypothetical protein
MSNDNTSWHGISVPNVHTLDDLAFMYGLVWKISYGRRTKRTRMDYVMRLIRVVYQNTLSAELEKQVANTLLAKLDKQVAELDKSGRYRLVKNPGVVDFWS